MTCRSKKRRRSLAPPRKTPSIFGVNQTIRTRSARSDAVAGAPSSRIARLLPDSPDSRPTPILRSSSSVADTVHPWSASCRVMSGRAAARRPRPGPSWLIASSTLVFPAPFAPQRQTGRESSFRSSCAWLRKLVRRRRVRAVTRPVAASTHIARWHRLDPAQAPGSRDHQTGNEHLRPRSAPRHRAGISH